MSEKELDQDILNDDRFQIDDDLSEEQYEEVNKHLEDSEDDSDDCFDFEEREEVEEEETKDSSFISEDVIEDMPDVSKEISTDNKEANFCESSKEESKNYNTQDDLVQKDEKFKLEDISLNLSFRIGTSKITYKELSTLQPGMSLGITNISDNIDILINGKLFATGELINFDDVYGVKLIEIYK